MKRITRFSLVVLCGLLASFALVSPVMALGDTLTITPGGSGAWVTGGYDFGGTAYAEKTGFTPLHGLDQFSLVVWLNPSVVDYNVLVTQRVDATHNVRLYINSDDKAYFQLSDGVGGLTLATTINYTADNLLLIVVAWDKDDNSGKPDLYMNTTGITAGTGITDPSSCDIDMRLGAHHDDSGAYDGIMYQVLLYSSKLSSADVSTIFAAGEESYLEGYWHYWAMEEGEGNYFYEIPPTWKVTQEVEVNLETPRWIVAQTVIQKTYSPIFEGNIMFLVSLAGLALVPMSTVYLARGGKDDLSWRKMEVFFFLFFFGWAMFLGGLAV